MLKRVGKFAKDKLGGVLKFTIKINPQLKGIALLHDLSKQVPQLKSLYDAYQNVVSRCQELEKENAELIGKVCQCCRKS